MHRRRHYRRNPAVLGIGGLPPLQSVIYAGVGFAGVPLVEGFLSPMLPVSITTSTIGKYAVKIGSVIGLSALARMIVGREAARMVGIGGGAYVLVSAVREFAPGMIPGMGAYTQINRGMGAYKLNAYTPGAPNLPLQAQGDNVIAARFRRFS